MVILTMLNGCAGMSAPLPPQNITAVICPQLADHDDVTDSEADEEADNLPEGSAIKAEHFELKDLRAGLMKTCGAT
jgi:hypothetical protein